VRCPKIGPAGPRVADVFGPLGPACRGIGHNVSVSGKRAGPKRKRRFDPALLFLAIGVTFCVVAWGYLVKAAIDFGVTARGGEQGAWLFLGLASLGAVACLFVGLILVARIMRRLGITRSPSSSDAKETTAEQPRIPGGRRAMR
jgi:hypothetical protein